MRLLIIKTDPASYYDSSKEVSGGSWFSSSAQLAEP